MSLGIRLKEERTRLGLTQAEFAKSVSASTRSLISWEKDEASPNSSALAAMSEAGVDVIYVLTNRHSPDRWNTAETPIEDNVAVLERNLLEPDRCRLPGENEDQMEERVRKQTANALRSIQQFDAPFLTPELRERVSELLNIANDPMKVSQFRAADYAQMRKKREQMKERLARWLEGGPYEPGDVVMGILTLLALEYVVPVKILVNLVEEIHADIAVRQVPK